MKTTRREKLLILLWAWLAVYAAVRPFDKADAANGDTAKLSGYTDSAYDTDRQTAAFRSALAVVDTQTTAGILATTAFKVGGRTTITVGARFSAAAQSCTVQLVYVYKTFGSTDSDTNTTPSSTTATNYIKGYSAVTTLTGSADQKEGAYYEAPDTFFDSGRAVTVRVILVSAPASGTVTFWVGS